MINCVIRVAMLAVVVEDVFMSPVKMLTSGVVLQLTVEQEVEMVEAVLGVVSLSGLPMETTKATLSHLKVSFLMCAVFVWIIGMFNIIPWKERPSSAFYS